MNNLRFFLTILVLTFSFMFSEASEKLSRAQSLYGEGSQLKSECNYNEAVDKFLACMSEADKEGSPKIHALCQRELGMIYLQFEDYERSVAYFSKCSREAKNIGDRDLDCEALARIAATYAIENKPAEARKYYAQQIQAGGSSDVCRYFEEYNLALINHIEGNYDAALQHAFKGLDVARRHNMGTNYLNSLYGVIGITSSSLGDIGKAMEYFDKYKQYAEGEAGLRAMATYCEMIANHYGKSGDIASADLFTHKKDSINNLLTSQKIMKDINNKVFSFEDQSNTLKISKLAAKARQYLWIIVAFLVLLVGLAMTISVIVRKQKKLKEAYRHIIEQNRDLSARERKLLDILNTINTQSPAPEQEDIPKDNEEQKEDNDTSDAAAPEKGQRQDVGLTRHQAEILLSKIMGVMNDVEEISKSDFNLNRLAQLCESNTRYVSWVINDTYEKNFKYLLNQYRIREVCRRIDDKEHYGNVTISTISKDLGYNSHSNFIAAFKSVMGMLPSAYMKSGAKN